MKVSRRKEGQDLFVLFWKGNFCALLGDSDSFSFILFGTFSHGLKDQVAIKLNNKEVKDL